MKKRKRKYSVRDEERIRNLQRGLRCSRGVAIKTLVRVARVFRKPIP